MIKAFYSHEMFNLFRSTYQLDVQIVIFKHAQLYFAMSFG